MQRLVALQGQELPRQASNAEGRTMWVVRKLLHWMQRACVDSRRRPWLNSVLNLAASYAVIVQLSALVARRHVLTAVVFHVPGELPGENKT